MEKRDLEMFGCYREEIDAYIADCIGPKEMYAISVLSDAQEILARGDAETARQWINKAKYVMSQIVVQKLENV
jgi:3-deoxy-D-arabino-heptulosonate 7-phosphate (DAHP) synthase